MASQHDPDSREVNLTSNKDCSALPLRLETLSLAAPHGRVHLGTAIIVLCAWTALLFSLAGLPLRMSWVRPVLAGREGI